MPTERQVEQRIGKLGDLLSSHEGTADLERYAEYESDPVRFSREVLGDTDPGPWSHQRRVMDLVAHQDRVAWRGAQGCGKDWTVTRLALWWVYSVGGLVLLSGPTARQVHEILMRKEVARAFRRAGLPGDLYTTALRVEGEEASILAFTSSEASGLTGYHDRRVLAVLTEAQAVEAHGWEGLMACVTGAGDRLLVVGNPLEPVGEFFEVSRPDSGWQTVQTAATDHPNLTGEAHIPGGPSEEWLERMRDMWGEGSPMWTARVGGEFPQDAVQGLYRRDWIEAAINRRPAGEDDPEPVVAVDVARHGLDESVAAIVRGDTVERLVSWSGANTTETVEKVKEVAVEAGCIKDHDLGIKLRRTMRVQGKPVPPYGRIVVDEVGVGGGVVDQLQDQGWPTTGFKGSRRADDPSRHANARAEAFWTMRELLEEGEVSLPDDRRLREELLAVKWSPDSKGRVQIEAKADLRSRLGRSPDRLDAVCMAFSHAGRKGAGMTAEEMQTRW